MPHPPLAKVSLTDLDRQPLVPALHAQYNPKELQVDRTASWTPTPTGAGNHPELTFASTNARTLALELFYDTFEDGFDVHATHVQKLVKLMDVMEPESRDEDKKRPPRVMLCWGDKLPPFIGVIESVTTKYTMFLPDGTPVRATCSVKLIEASRESWKKRR
jgi:hypothetical protein